eukprot:g7336.t1
MMSYYIALLSLCLAFSLVESNDESKVHVLTKESFSKNVQDSKNLWIVRYTESEEEIVPGFEEAASALVEYGIHFGVVDCSEAMSVCRQSNLNTLPSVKYFAKLPELNPYTKRSYRRGQTYTGKLVAKSLKKLASRKMPNYVNKDSPRAIFVTSKDKISPLMKAVAIHFHDRLSLGHVNFNTDSTYGEETRLVLVSNEEEVDKAFEINKKTTVSEIIELLEPFASEEKQAMYADGVHRITSSSQIEDENTAWVVAYVEDDVLQDKLVEAANEAANAGIVHVGVVKCSNNENKNLCKDVKVPSVATYKFGKKTRPRFFDTSINKALKHAIKSVPNHVQTGMEAMMDQYLVASIQRMKISTFFLSNKEQDVPTALQSSCALFKDEIDCVAISNPSRSLLERFSMQKVKLPQLFAVIAINNPNSAVENEQEQIQFQLISFAGDTQVFDEVSQFGDTLVKTVLPQVFPNRENSKEEEDVVVSSVEKEFVELTAENFQEACVKPCVVAFLEDTTPDTASIETLRKAHEKYKSVFDFYYVNGACQHEFAKSFDIDTYMMPAVSLWARDKGKMVKMLGSYTEDTIRSFLRDVRRGKHVPVALESEPQSLVKSCEIVAENVEEDDIDLDELLADIRREEQMEKERQEEEVASAEIEEVEDANPEWSERLKELNKASTKKKKKRKRRRKKKKKKKKKRKRSEL